MIEACFFGVFGLLIGSFLNVCIHRLPQDLSVVRPRSRCGDCGHPIAAYDNIPLFSFALLGGRCRHCRAAISWRYPLVELLTGLLFLAGYLLWGPTLGSVKFAIFASLMLGMVFTDLETRILPDEFTLGGVAAGLALALVVRVPPGLGEFLLTNQPRWASLFDAAFAAAFAAGALWLVGAVYNRIRHREGLGFGDIKMVATMGAFLGLSPTLLAILVGCVAGSMLGLAYIFFAKKEAASYELPFGSFLGAAAILVALWGPGMLRWYGTL